MPSSWSRRSRPISRRIREPLADGCRPSGRWAQITAPIIAITLVLLSVFVPVAFIPGHLGPALPAVRGGGRGLDGDLGDQRADPGARPCAPCCCATITGRSAARSATCWARSTGRATAMPRSSSGWCAMAVFSLVVRRRRVLALNALPVQGDPRPASCRRRTRAPSSSRRSCPRAPRSTAPPWWPSGSRAFSRTSRASPTSARSSATARWMALSKSNSAYFIVLLKPFEERDRRQART